MTKLIFSVFTIAALAASAAPSPNKKPDLSKLPPATRRPGITFAGDIQKVFETSCVKCHGPEKSKGRLRLDSIEAALKGGESGKVIIPGKSAESIIVHNVAQIGDEDHYMPPPGNKAGIKPLSPEQIGLIRGWIDQGAK